MLKEYDVVCAKYELSATVPKGARGVILYVYGQPSLAYEVEFLDAVGKTLGVLTVRDEAIKPFPVSHDA